MNSCMTDMSTRLAQFEQLWTKTTVAHLIIVPLTVAVMGVGVTTAAS